MKTLLCGCLLMSLVSSWAVAQEAVPDSPDDGTLVAPTVHKKTPAPKAEPTALVPAPEPNQEAPQPLPVHRWTDEALSEAWRTWLSAHKARDVDAERSARATLLQIHAETGFHDMDAWSLGLLRGALEWEAAGDSGAAVEMASTAIALAPRLPAVWFAWARLAFAVDATAVGRWMGALRQGVGCTFRDARFFRPLSAESAGIFLLGWMMVSVLATVVLLIRHHELWRHDAHLLLAPLAPGWTSWLLAAALVVAPWAFGVPLLWALVLAFAALTFYLSGKERTVLAVLLLGLSCLPLAARRVVTQLAFAQTPAEPLYRLEHQTPDARRWVDLLEATGRRGYAERYVLGSYYLSRGFPTEAAALFKEALVLEPEGAEAKVALATCFLMQGDLENSRSLLESVKVSHPSAVALSNLSRVYERRVALYGAAAAGEVDKAEVNWLEARKLDPTLVRRDDDEGANPAALRMLPLSSASLVALAESDGAQWAQRMESQLSWWLMNESPGSRGWFMALGIIVAIWGIGHFGGRLGVATPCQRCGRPVSQKADPSVPAGSKMCGQCINVFVRTDLVSATERNKKQLAIARRAERLSRVKKALGLGWAGLGHVFDGRPWAGVLWGLVFAALLVRLFFWAGLLRLPFDLVPTSLKLAPALVALVIVYASSWWSLRREK